jgi:Transmembrane protein 43
MAEDSFTEVSSRSWFSRIGGAFKGIIFGFILMAVAFGLLFWNEGRAVERHKTLQEGGGIVQSVSAKSVDPGNEGRLVHVTGRAETTETLADPEMGVRTQAIALIREVESYQWKESSRSETRKKLGGGEETVTTYTYGKEWSGKIIDSASFKKPDGHANPGRMAYQSKTIRAENVRLGVFKLPDFLVQKIAGESPLTLSSDVRPPQTQLGTVQKQASGFYFGQDSNAPQVGDLRMTYRVVLPAEISLVARQVGASFEPYKATAGGSIELLSMGSHAAEAMFQEAKQHHHDLDSSSCWVCTHGHRGKYASCPYGCNGRCCPGYRIAHRRGNNDHFDTSFGSAGFYYHCYRLVCLPTAVGPLLTCRRRGYWCAALQEIKKGCSSKSSPSSAGDSSSDSRRLSRESRSLGAYPLLLSEGITALGLSDK